jgi:hypothetical protein
MDRCLTFLTLAPYFLVVKSQIVFALLYTTDTLIYIITLNHEDALVLVVYFIHTHGIVGCKIKDLVV